MTSKRLIRWLSLPAGVIIFFVGAVLFPLPIPLGVFLMVLGLAVAATNPLVLRFLKRMRKRFPRINHTLRGITHHMPPFIRRILNRTDSSHRL